MLTYQKVSEYLLTKIGASTYLLGIHADGDVIDGCLMTTPDPVGDYSNYLILVHRAILPYGMEFIGDSYYYTLVHNHPLLRYYAPESNKSQVYFAILHT